MEKIDWKTIREAYITGETSYRELAEKTGIAFQSIGRKAKQERWVILRSEHRHKVLTEMMREKAKGRARANIEALDDVLMLTELIKGYARDMMENDVLRTATMKSGRDWESIAGMVEKLEGITRRYVDAQTEAERRAEKRAEKKLKAEMEKSESKGPQEIKVTMDIPEEFKA